MDSYINTADHRSVSLLIVTEAGSGLFFEQQDRLVATITSIYTGFTSRKRKVDCKQQQQQQKL